MNLPAPPGPAHGPAADTLTGTPQAEAPPDALFAALLNLQTARTAPAEGQTPDTPTTQDATMPGATTPDATTVAELVAAVPVAAPLAPVAPAAAAPAVATPAAPAAQSQPAKAAVAPPVVPGQLPAPQAPVAIAPAVAAPAPDAPTPDATTPDAPTPDAPTTPLSPTAQDAPNPAAPGGVRRAQPATPAVPGIAPAIPAVPAHVAQKAKGRPVAEPANAPQPTATETKEARKDSPRPAAPTPQPEVASTQPKERPVVAHGAPEPRPVLRGERVEALVRLATRHGAAEARMELHPQELGSVVVKLRMTSDGLQATFTASNPEALTQLQQAGDDLRRSLEAKGLTLATLDVRAETDQSGEEPRDQRGWARAKHGHAVEQIDEEPIATVSVPAGELIDVHA